MSAKPEPAAAAPPGRAALARGLRQRLGPPPRREEWPPVSIVVVNRDGEDHLRLLLPRLAEATDYPALELILIDNGSRDGSVEVARSLPLPFPLVVIENEENVPFSDANDEGAERASHELLLFLNNDVEPFEPGWLKELVASLLDGEAVAAGATLLRRREPRDLPGGTWAVQHRRVELTSEAGFLRIVNAGDGEELEELGAAPPAAASTAACLLVEADAFRRAGGFTTGYLWGWEDVDFALKLASAGEGLVCSGRSLLIHRESSTRAAASREWQRTTRSRNRRLFAERWGPQVRREYLLDRLATRGFWTDSRPPLLALALSGRAEVDAAALELADAIEEEGWRVAAVEPPAGGDPVPTDADFALLTDPACGASLPAGVPCVVWASDRAGAWAAAPLLRRAELTLVSRLSLAPDLEAAGIAPVLFPGAADAARLTGLLRERVQRLRFCLKLSREWRLEPAALALRRSLEARGHGCSLQLVDEWELLAGHTADVALVCGDPGDYLTKPGQLNVLWRPEGGPATACDQWDLILVADEATASALGAETPALVAALDLDAAGDPAEPLLELVARAAAREGLRAGVGSAAGAQLGV